MFSIPKADLVKANGLLEVGGTTSRHCFTVTVRAVNGRLQRPEGAFQGPHSLVLPLYLGKTGQQISEKKDHNHHDTERHLPPAKGHVEPDSDDDGQQDILGGTE